MKSYENLKIYCLSNSATALILPDSHTDLCAFHVWYKVGSCFETEDNLGVSHFIEHLFFKGSQNYGPGEIDRRLNEIGAFNNAATSKDYTFYYTIGRAEFFDEMFDIQSDMVLRPTFDPHEIDKERDVVIAEIHRANDTPPRKLYNAIMQQLYGQHPYSTPVLGYENIIATISPEKIREYYQTHYHPKNMTIIAAGNFDPNKVLDKIETTFLTLKEQDKSPRQAPRIYLHPSSIVIYENTKKHMSTLNFIGPDATNIRDVLALDILSVILTNSKSSRWKKLIKEELELVESIHLSLYTSTLQSPIVLQAVVREEKWDEYQRVVREELLKLKKFYVTREELHFAKEFELIQHAYQMEKLSSKAENLGYWGSLNQLQSLLEYKELIHSIALEDMIRVIEKYLNTEPLEVSMRPKETKQIQDIGKKGGKLYRKEPVKETKLEENTWLYEMDNGLKILHSKEDSEISIAQILVNRITEYTERFPHGTLNLMQEVIHRGTSSLNASAIMEKMDRLGARYSTTVGALTTRRDTWSSQMKAPKNNFQEAFSVFSSFFTDPVFPQKEIDKIKESIRLQIKTIPDQLSSHCMEIMMEHYFHNHPYGESLLGSLNSVSEITRRDIQELHSVMYTPSSMMIAIAGDLNREEVLNLVHTHLSSKMGSLKIEISEARVPSVWESPNLGKTIAVHSEKEQAYLIPTYPAPGIFHPDYHAALLTSEILGGGMSSRYFRNMRDEKSYGYEIGSRYIGWEHHGIFFSYLGTNPDRVDCALVDFRREIDKIATQPIAPEELEKARKLLLSRRSFSKETLSDRIGLKASHLIRNLPWHDFEAWESRLMKVTPEDISNFCKNWLKTPLIAVVSPKADLS